MSASVYRATLISLPTSTSARRGAYVCGIAAWQSGGGIFGIEADAAVARSRSSVTCISSAASCQMNASALYSIRPRFGWVIDNSMIYGTGGLAIVTSDSSVVNNATGQRLGTNGAANYGVAVGAGIEHKFSPNLGLRAEVMHYGFPGLTVSLPGGEVESRYQTTVGRVGISWYFN